MAKVGESGDQAKTSRAYRVKDECIYEAWELKGRTDIGDDEFWLCTHKKCTALMEPVGWRELKKDGTPYRVPAYFTSWDVNQHHPDCRAPVEREAAEASLHDAKREMGAPEEIPDRVIFETDQAQDVEPSGDEPRAADPDRIAEVRSVPGRGGFVPEGTRSTSQSTIRKCCKVFVESDAHHTRPLTVDGCFGNRYGAVFAPLVPSRAPLLVARRVLYAEAYMKGLRDRHWSSVVEGTIRLPLLATVSEEARSVRRYLEIDVSRWKPEAAEDFVRRAREAAEAGWASYCKGGRSRPWVFFVGVLEDPLQLVMKVEQEAMVEVLAAEMPPHAFHEAEASLRRARVDLRTEASSEADETAPAVVRWAAEHDEAARGSSPDTILGGWEDWKPSLPITLLDESEDHGRGAGGSRNKPVDGVVADDNGRDGMVPLGRARAEADPPQGDSGEAAEPLQNIPSGGAGGGAAPPGESDKGRSGPRIIDTGSDRDGGGRVASDKASDRPTAGVTNHLPAGRHKPETEVRSGSGRDAEPGRRKARSGLIGKAQRLKDRIARALRSLFG